MMLIFSSTCLTFSEKASGILGGTGGKLPSPLFFVKWFLRGHKIGTTGSGQKWYQIKFFMLCFWLFRGPPDLLMVI